MIFRLFKPRCLYSSFSSLIQPLHLTTILCLPLQPYYVLYCSTKHRQNANNSTSDMSSPPSHPSLCRVPRCLLCPTLDLANFRPLRPVISNLAPQSTLTHHPLCPLKLEDGEIPDKDQSLLPTPAFTPEGPAQISIKIEQFETTHNISEKQCQTGRDMSTNQTTNTPPSYLWTRERNPWTQNKL